MWMGLFLYFFCLLSAPEFQPSSPLQASIHDGIQREVDDCFFLVAVFPGDRVEQGAEIR